MLVLARKVKQSAEIRKQQASLARKVKQSAEIRKH